MIKLNQFGVIPIDYKTLITSLEKYKSPKDKVTRMEREGEIIRLKKGLFVVAQKVHLQTLSRELIANHLYGPSYVSCETALSFYGLIPERVYMTKSMTMKRSKSYSTSLGNFEYLSVNEDYFAIGIRQEIVENKFAFMIATPEKALCDLIISTKGLKIQSMKSIQIYLEEDLRMDISTIQNFNFEIIRQCSSESNKKKTELTQILKVIEL
jgi:predicted transcriptional regulator of viral defense system